MVAADIMHMATNSAPDCSFVMRWIVADDDSVMLAHLCYPKDVPKDNEHFHSGCLSMKL